MPLIAKVGRRRFKVRLLIGAITSILWIGVALHLFPVWWMFTTSLKPAREIFEFPPSLWPKSPSFICYKLIFELSAGTWAGGNIRVLDYPIYVYIKNSIIMAGGIMCLQIPFTALMGYALSKLYSSRWSRIVFLFCIGTLMIPGEVSLIPSYLILRHFPFPTKHIPVIPFTNILFPHYNFLDSYWAVILPGMYSAFNVLLFKGFFDGIPTELVNAARLDGASELGIIRRIIIPVSKPVFAVVTYFSFSSAWNQFMWPLIVIRNNKLMPLSVILYKFQFALTQAPPTGKTPEEQRLMAAGVGYNGLMALSFIESIPVFIMFLIFREQLMTGIKLRGFK